MPFFFQCIFKNWYGRLCGGLHRNLFKHIVYCDTKVPSQDCCPEVELLKFELWFSTLNLPYINKLCRQVQCCHISVPPCTSIGSATVPLTHSGPDDMRSFRFLAARTFFYSFLLRLFSIFNNFLLFGRLKSRQTDRGLGRRTDKQIDIKTTFHFSVLLLISPFSN